MRTILWLVLFAVSTANKCHKHLSYHMQFNYGYDITCQNLTIYNTDEISNLTVYNEITATIANSSIALDTHLFGKLKKLREIRITNSTIVNSQYATFDRLNHLEKLVLEHDNLTVIYASMFYNLTGLKSLSLSHNSLSMFHNNTWIKADALTELNLGYNHISDVSNLFLCPLQNLEILDFQYNDLVKLLEHDLSCLHRLSTLNLNNNKILQITDLTVPNLNELSLNHNLLNHTNLNLHCPYLQTLYIAYNKLMTINPEIFKNISHLRIIDFSHNIISHIDEATFKYLTNITEIYLNNNRLRNFKLQVPKLKKLILSGNNLTNIILGNMNYIKSLEVLDLSQNNLEHITKDLFKNSDNLLVLKLSDNHLKNFGFQFPNKTQLKELRLNNNLIARLELTDFQHMSHLLTLDLSLNFIELLTDGIFRDLYNLEHLNLSYNRLKLLKVSNLNNLENLKALDVGNNFIQDLEYDLILKHLMSLRVINVKNNLLSCGFLTKMIHFFKNHSVNFTINENFTYDQENVAGIYCTEYKSKLNDSALLQKDSLLLSELYDLTKTTDNEFRYEILIVACSLISIVCLVGILVYRLYVLKLRKQKLIDEIQLICSYSKNPYRSLDNNM